MAGTILVYGATGYTGRRVARELRRLGADFVIAGRDAGRLASLAADLGDVPTRVADASGTLEGLADGCSVLVSTVGPFTLYGEAAVAEALRAGAHFCDTTGEQAYMKRVLDRFDREARDKGVTVLNAQALEFAVGYCLAAALLAKHPDSETIDVFNRVWGFGTSRGTKKSALRAGAAEALVLRDGQLVDRGASPVPLDVTWPGEGKVLAAPFPGGEALHLPRLAPSLRNVTTNLVLPAPAAWAMTAGLALRGLMRALEGSALQRWIEGRIDAGAEGPRDAEAEAAKWAVLVRARGPFGETFARADGHDVYGVSGTLAALGGLWLAEGRARTAGVVSTGEAFDPAAFLDALADRGVRWSLAPVAPPREAR